MTQEPVRTNAERFLVAFNRVERRLAALAGVEEHRAFGEKLRGAVRREPLVARIMDNLREMAELRNAIVHSDREMPLADPRDDVVAEIERYAELLTEPPRVRSLFSREVATVGPEDSVRHAVQRMRSQRYSQLAVRDARGRCDGLLTDSAIARWLGGAAQQGRVDLDAATVADVLAGDGEPPRHVFMRPDDTLHDALYEFESHQRAGRRLEAILVCENGRADGRLVGIITPRDLPAILNALQLPADGR